MYSLCIILCLTFVSVKAETNDINNNNLFQTSQQPTAQRLSWPLRFLNAIGFTPPRNAVEQQTMAINILELAMSFNPQMSVCIPMLFCELATATNKVEKSALEESVVLLADHM